MSRKSILIVDDEVYMRDMLFKYFEGEGYDITLAESGFEAYKQAQDTKFDVGLIDFRMPGMNGIELTKLLVNKDPQVVLIIMTGYPSAESTADATKLGVYAYVTKPFRLIDMGRVVEQGLKERDLQAENRLLRKKLQEAQKELKKQKDLDKASESSSDKPVSLAFGPT